MFVVERGNLCTHDPKFVLGFIRLRCSRVFGDYRPVCNALFHKVSALVIEGSTYLPGKAAPDVNVTLCCTLGKLR